MMRIKNILPAVAAIALTIAACKKKDLIEEAPRIFRPVLAGSLSADSNTIVAAWQKISGAESYEFQISRDTFRTIDASLQLDSNAAVIKGLKYNQLYQMQVKAIASDTARNSKWSYLGAVKTESSILKVPTDSDVTDEAVRVSWTTKGAPVSLVKILKAADSSLVTEVNLTGADRANGYKIIGGLLPSANYIILLYSEADLRGDAAFITKTQETGIIIDLRGITERPSVLADTIPFIPSGSIVYLKRGETYTISSAVLLDKSITIKSGDDLSTTDRGMIYFTSNFNFAANSVIDSIVFNDVYMRSDNYSSRYVFNTDNSATVGTLRFENCTAEIFRGLVRLKAGNTTVSNFKINNCIIDSVKDYGVFNVDNVTCKAENISITNSTIYKAQRVLVSKQNSTSLLIENCTFNEAPLGVTATNGYSYYINYSTSSSNTVTDGIIVNNCLFGTGIPNGGTTDAVRDVNVNSATTVNASNNYRTSDHVSGGNDFPNINTHTKTAAQVWQDPANGNFKIIDASFPKNNCGDPRWR